MAGWVREWKTGETQSTKPTVEQDEKHRPAASTLFALLIVIHLITGTEQDRVEIGMLFLASFFLHSLSVQGPGDEHAHDHTEYDHCQHEQPGQYIPRHDYHTCPF